MGNKVNGFLISSGNGNIVNYNRIYENGLGGNVLSPASNTNATANWWGYNNISNQYENASFINVSDWFVLELSSLDINTIVNYTKVYNNTTNYPENLIYNFTRYNYTGDDNHDLLPYFTVNIIFKNVTDNDVLQNITGKDIRNQVTYTQAINFSSFKLYSVEALSDGEDVILAVAGLNNISINKTVDNTNPYFGDNVTFNITINNIDGNEDNLIVNETLPDGLTYVSDDSDGQYNSSTGV